MTDTGAATVLEWSPDSRVLAVGYARRGLSLWSLFGCRLQCAIFYTIYLPKYIIH